LLFVEGRRKNKKGEEKKIHHECMGNLKCEDFTHFMTAAAGEMSQPTRAITANKGISAGGLKGRCSPSTCTTTKKKKKRQQR
jgi:hypothetical protein